MMSLLAPLSLSLFMLRNELFPVYIFSNLIFEWIWPGRQPQDEGSLTVNASAQDCND